MFPPQNNGMPPRPPQGGAPMPPRPMQPGMPPQGAAPGGPPPGPGQGQDGRSMAIALKQQLPPAAARMIDENNPAQIAILDRFKTLQPQDLAALAAIDRPAMMALKKVVPEAYVMLVLVKLGSGQQQPQGVTTGPAAEAEMRGMEQAARPMPPRPAGPPAMPRPQTQLGQV